MDENMRVLGIENRTENWMTARKFAPLFENGKACLAFASRPSFIPNIVSSEV